MLWRYALSREHVHCYLDNAKLRIKNGKGVRNTRVVYESRSSVYEIQINQYSENKKRSNY